MKVEPWPRVQLGRRGTRILNTVPVRVRLQVVSPVGLPGVNGSFTVFFAGHPIALGLVIAALCALTLPLIRTLREKSRKEVLQ